MGRQREPVPATRAGKTCVSCGRRIEWRSAWAKSWDGVRYCSRACRRHGVTAEDGDLETRIMSMLADRPRSSTVTDTEVARAAASPTGEPDLWRTLMEPSRRAARRLVARGDVVITQGGHVVDPSSAKGPIAIRRA